MKNFKCIIICPEILTITYIQKSMITIYIMNQNIFRRHWHNLFYPNRGLVTLIEKFQQFKEWYNMTMASLILSKSNITSYKIWTSSGKKNVLFTIHKYVTFSVLHTSWTYFEQLMKFWIIKIIINIAPWVTSDFLLLPTICQKHNASLYFLRNTS